MNHQDALVIILNDSGKIIGSKPRKDIDKIKDIVWCCDVLVMNAEHQLFLSNIPAGHLYSGTWGSTAATMLRENELPGDAAFRALEKELGIEDVSITNIGEKFFIYDDGVKRKKTIYLCETEDTPTPNPNDIADIRAWTRTDLESAILSNPTMFSTTFLQIWKLVNSELPF